MLGGAARPAHHCNGVVLTVVEDRGRFTGGQPLEIIHRLLFGPGTRCQVHQPARELPDTAYCTPLALDPTDPGRLYIRRERGVRVTVELTTDAGQTWRQVERYGEASPARVERLVTVSGGEVYVSPDRGRTWLPAPGQPADLQARRVTWTRDGTAFWVAAAGGLYRVAWP